MKDYMPIILDLAVVLSIFAFVYISAKRGFLSTVVRFLGYLASVMASSWISRWLGEKVYQRWIRPTLLESISEKLSEMIHPEQLVKDIVSFLDELPVLLRNALSYDSQGLSQSLQQFAQSGDSIAEGLVDTVLYPTVIGLTQTVLFLICFLLCLVIVRLVAGMLTQVKRIPVIGPMNSLLGGIFGFFESILFLFLAMLLLNLLFSLTNDSISWLNRSVVSSTFLLNNFLRYNPFI